MKIPRIYTGPDGETHFGEIDYPEDKIRTADKWSTPISTEAMEIMDTSRQRENPPFINPPRRLMAITLAGTHEVIASDSHKHIAGPGDILIFEDTTGKGHISQSITPPPHKVIYVMLD